MLAGLLDINVCYYLTFWLMFLIDVFDRSGPSKQCLAWKCHSFIICLNINCVHAFVSAFFLRFLKWNFLLVKHFNILISKQKRTSNSTEKNSALHCSSNHQTDIVVAVRIRKELRHSLLNQAVIKQVLPLLCHDCFFASFYWFWENYHCRLLAGFLIYKNISQKTK